MIKKKKTVVCLDCGHEHIVSYGDTKQLEECQECESKKLSKVLWPVQK